MLAVGRRAPGAARGARACGCARVRHFTARARRARYSNPAALGGAIEACVSLGKQVQARFMVPSPVTRKVMQGMLALNKQQGTNPFNK